MMKRMRNLFRAHEDNLTRLTARRDDLARPLAEAEAGFDRITAERRRLLIDADDPDGPALERAERDWLTAHGRFAALERAERDWLTAHGRFAALERAERDWLTAHGRFAALQDAHREVVERIAAAQETLAAEQDRAERTRAARDLEARAAAIDAAAASLSDTLEGVAVAHGALVDAIRAGGLPADPTWPVAPEASAAAILLAAVERIVPGRMALVVQTGIAPEGASESARRLQSDPLRTLAEAIRNGEADPVASEPVSTGAQMQPAPSWPERAIAVLRPFTYRNLASAPVLVTEGSALVPGPVAERAIARELALSADTPEGRTALAQHREGRPARLRPPEAIGVTDLDLDLGAWAEGGQREAA